jgi:hypothetical protein
VIVQNGHRTVTLGPKRRSLQKSHSQLYFGKLVEYPQIPLKAIDFMSIWIVIFPFVFSFVVLWLFVEVPTNLARRPPAPKIKSSFHRFEWRVK